MKIVTILVLARSSVPEHEAPWLSTDPSCKAEEVLIVSQMSGRPPHEKERKPPWPDCT